MKRFVVVLAACAPEASLPVVDTGGDDPRAAETATWSEPAPACAGVCLTWLERELLPGAPDGSRPEVATPACNALGPDLGVCPGALTCGSPRSAWDADGRGVVAALCEGRADYLPVWLERPLDASVADRPVVAVQLVVSVGGRPLPALQSGAIARLVLHGRGDEGDHVVPLSIAGAARLERELPVGRYAVEAFVLGDVAGAEIPERYAVAARGLLDVTAAGEVEVDLPAGRLRLTRPPQGPPLLPAVQVWSRRSGWIAAPAEAQGDEVRLWLAPDEVQLEQRLRRSSVQATGPLGTWTSEPTILPAGATRELRVDVRTRTLVPRLEPVVGLRVGGARLRPHRDAPSVELVGGGPFELVEGRYDLSLILYGDTPAGPTQGLARVASDLPAEGDVLAAPKLAPVDLVVGTDGLGPSLSVVLVAPDGSWQGIPVADDGRVHADASWVARGAVWLVGGELRGPLRLADDVELSGIGRLDADVPVVTLAVEGVDFELPALQLQRVDGALGRPWRRWDDVVPRVPVVADGVTPQRVPRGTYRVLAGEVVLPTLLRVDGDGLRTLRLEQVQATVELFTRAGLLPGVPPGQSRGLLQTAFEVQQLAPVGRAKATVDALVGVPLDVVWRCAPSAACTQGAVVPLATGVRLLAPTVSD